MGLRPDQSALRELIETDKGTPWSMMRVDNVYAACEEFTRKYSKFFKTQGIDHALLSTPDPECPDQVNMGCHNYLAIPTADAGILIFDPTIRQFFPQYTHHYFLGKPEELLTYVQAHGGLDRPLIRYEVLAPHVTARTAYLEPRLTTVNTSEDRGHLVNLREWKDALRVLELQIPWVSHVDQREADSGKHASP